MSRDWQVHLTNSCSLRCQHCYTSSRRDERGWLPLPVFDAICEFADRRDAPGRFRVIGGEVVTPTLQVNDYLSVATSYGLPLVLSTNGVYAEAFEQETLRLDGVREVVLSLYGPEKEHEAVTGTPGTYGRTMRTLHALMQRGWPRVTVNTSILATNVHVFAAWLKQLAAMRVPRIKVLSLSPLGHAVGGTASNAGTAYEALRVSSERKAKELLDLDEAFASLMNHGTELVVEVPDIGERLVHSSHRPRCKIARRKMVTVGSDGTVYPCHLLIGQKTASVGNVVMEPASQVFERLLSATAALQREKALWGGVPVCPAYREGARTADLSLEQSDTCPMHLESRSEERKALGLFSRRTQLPVLHEECDTSREAPGRRRAQ